MAYLAITIFTCLMWFSEFRSESADIVHEAKPTKALMEQTKKDYFDSNYNDRLI